MKPPSSPASIHVRASPPPPWVRRSKLGVVALILSTMPFFSWAACTVRLVNYKEDEGTAFAVWGVTCALALAGGIAGIVSLGRLSRYDPEKRLSGRVLSTLAMVLGFLSPIATIFLGLATLNINFGHGRALRRRGKALVPDHVDDDGGWCDARAPVDAPVAVAAAWRASGASEAASVVAFANLADDLAMLAAPGPLVARAHENAVDEVAHTRLCYSLAAAVDGQRLGPGAIVAPPDRSRAAARGDLVAFACENVVESCLFEGAAAHVATALATRDDVIEEARAALLVIARDEARHAAHGFDIVDWCRVRAGDDVVAACVRALRAVDSARVNTTSPDGLERFGVAGPSAWRASLEAARAVLLQRLSQPATSATAVDRAP